jgi:hypothetical protein
MEGTPDLDIGMDHDIHEAAEGHRKGKPAAELQCGEAKHGAQVAAETLR